MRSKCSEVAKENVLQCLDVIGGDGKGTFSKRQELTSILLASAVVYGMPELLSLASTCRCAECPVADWPSHLLSLHCCCTAAATSPAIIAASDGLPATSIYILKGQARPAVGLCACVFLSRLLSLLSLLDFP
jgi:hypothetical protein